MNPINLLLPDGTPSKVWACGQCKITRADQEHAEKCCTLVPCKVCRSPTDKKFRATCFTETCDACRTAEGQRKDAERLAKAEKLEAWDGWVYAGHGPNDGFFEDVGAYVDWLVDEAEDSDDWPDWVYAAKSRPGCVLDIGRILENACDDGYEDMDEDLRGVKELEAAIKAFNEANEGVIVYGADYKRAVRVPKPTTALSPTEATPDA